MIKESRDLDEFDKPDEGVEVAIQSERWHFRIFIFDFTMDPEEK